MGAAFASANQATAENPKIEAVHSANERTQQHNREDVVAAVSASANQAMAENPKIEAVHSVNERTQHQNREDVVGAACAPPETQQNQAVHSVRKDVLGVVEAACASANQPTAAK